jgi:hypothetical protein
MVVFRRSDVVPRIVAHETHLRLWKISFASPKRLFQEYRHLTGKKALCIGAGAKKGAEFPVLERAQ